MFVSNFHSFEAGIAKFQLQMTKNMSIWPSAELNYLTINSASTTNYLWINPYSAGIDLSRQNLKSVDPLIVRVKIFKMAVNP